MSGIPGYLHRIQISADSDDDSATAPAASHAYKVRSGLVVPTVDTRFHDNLSEGGRTTSLPEAIGQPISVDQAFSMGIFAYADALAHMTFLGANGGVSETGAQIPTTTGVYVHEWDWPGTASTTFISCFMEVLGRSGTSDDNQNRDLRNVILESFSISGSRDNAIEMTCNFRAGGVNADGGTGTGSLSIVTSRLLTFGMADLYHGPTAGFTDGLGGAATHGWAAAHTISDTDLLASGTPTVLSPYWQSFNLTFTKSPDAPRSKAPGLTDANGAGIVPDALDWVLNTNQPDCTLELVFDSTGTDEAAPGDVIALFPRDKEAGTMRGWELWLEDFTDTTVATPARLGAKYTFGRMQCIESNEVERGGGSKDLRTLWRPIYDADYGNGAHISVSSEIAVTLGG